jgi:hypothetical protein
VLFGEDKYVDKCLVDLNSAQRGTSV